VATIGDIDNVLRYLAAAIVLRREDVGIGCGLALGVPHHRKDMLLLQQALVIALAEIAKQDRGVLQRVGIDAGAALPQPLRDARIDQQRAAQHAMLAHHVFDGAGFLGVFVLALRRPGRRRRDDADRRRGCERAPCHFQPRRHRDTPLPSPR
jgi:hypothetical protein